MDEKSKIEMNTYYSGRLKEYGPTKEALVYRAAIQQTNRYALLADVEPMGRESSVLDVGCGLGYLCEFLRKYGWKGSYTGIDINPDMIRAAQRRLPNDHFVCTDILKEKFDENYDYVLCGATVQLKPKHEDHIAYLEQMIKKMFSLTRCALAFDVFSSRVDYQDEDNLYIDPLHLLRYCYTLTTRVALRNDHRPYEIMMYLYKKTAKNELNMYTGWTSREPRII